MKVIAIAMQKGGVGKSTLTRSLGVAATRAGLNTLILDMDAQQSTHQWAKRRKEALPPVRFIGEPDLADVLDKAKAAGCELAIIDTPPARSSEAPAAIEAADFVLIPCTPDIEAFEQLPRTVRLCRMTDKPFASVLTLATPNAKSEREAAEAVFQRLDIEAAPQSLHRLKAHRDATRAGMTAEESEPDSKAAAEIAALWQWVCAHLQFSKAAKSKNRKVA